MDSAGVQNLATQLSTRFQPKLPLPTLDLAASLDPKPS